MTEHAGAARPHTPGQGGGTPPFGYPREYSGQDEGKAGYGRNVIGAVGGGTPTGPSPPLYGTGMASL